MIPQKDLSVLQFLNFVGQMTRDNGLYVFLRCRSWVGPVLPLVLVTRLRRPGRELPSTTAGSSSSIRIKVCLIVISEITYFYPGSTPGVRKAADLTKPIDKRVYKGTCPTCHDFGPPGCLRNENVTRNVILREANIRLIRLIFSRK